MGCQRENPVSHRYGKPTSSRWNIYRCFGPSSLQPYPPAKAIPPSTKSACDKTGYLKWVNASLWDQLHRVYKLLGRYLVFNPSGHPSQEPPLTRTPATCCIFPTQRLPGTKAVFKDRGIRSKIAWSPQRGSYRLGDLGFVWNIRQVICWASNDLHQYDEPKQQHRDSWFSKCICLIFHLLLTIPLPQHVSHPLDHRPARACREPSSCLPPCPRVLDSVFDWRSAHRLVGRNGHGGCRLPEAPRLARAIVTSAHVLAS